MNRLDSLLYGMTTLIECGVASNKSYGSGFFYNNLAPEYKPVKDGKGYWQKIESMWLITNRHVALPKNGGEETLPDYLTFNLRENTGNNKIEWVPITLSVKELQNRMALHKDSKIDLVAIKIDDLLMEVVQKTSNKIIAPSALTSDNLPENSPIQIRVTSDIVVASYPRVFYDRFNKFPIIKSGIVASGWGMNFDGDPMFLIDTQLFPGSSGGVVISKPIDGHNLNKQFVLLGVYSGEPYYVEQLLPGVFEKKSYGLGVVWYSHLIPEIINTNEIKGEVKVNMYIKR